MGPLRPAVTETSILNTFRLLRQQWLLKSKRVQCSLITKKLTLNTESYFAPFVYLLFVGKNVFETQSNRVEDTSM